MKYLLSFLAVLFLASPASAMEGKVLSVGDEIPFIEAVDQNNQPQALETLIGENGTVLIFYRSVDWCPFCQKQLKKISKQSAAFAEKGYTLVGISYDSVSSLKRFDTKHKLGYSLLSDKDSKIIKSFGLLNDTVSEGSKAYGTPHPAIYVVNSDGEVKAILQEKGYKKRPEIEDILNAL